MNWAWVWLVVILALIVLYLSSTAGRLDRLHKRIDTAELALDAQLLRRSVISLELAASGLLDPATSIVLAEAAHTARAVPEDDPRGRGLAESRLTSALGESLPDPEDVAELREQPEGCELTDDLDAVTRRVELSRRFLNDGVRACRSLRGQTIVRMFGLAGRTPWPETFEMEDTPPAGFRLH